MTERDGPFTRLKPTLVFVAPLILVVAFAYYLRFREESRPVTLSIDFPATVDVAGAPSLAPVEFTLHLENSSGEDVDLIAANDCEVFRWYLLDQTGSFVQGQLLEDCGDFAVADALRGRGTLVRTTNIAFDTNRLTPGRRYDLMIQFWGYEARARFRAAAALPEDSS